MQAAVTKLFAFELSQIYTLSLVFNSQSQGFTCGHRAAAFDLSRHSTVRQHVLMERGRFGRAPSSDRQHKQQLIQELARRRQHKYISDSDKSSEASTGHSSVDSACSEASVVDLSEQSSGKHPTRPSPLPDNKLVSAPAAVESPDLGPETSHLCPKDSAAAEGADLLLCAPSAGKPVVLNSQLASRLYAHQVLGLKWLGTLYGKQSGGILGDDMGLGKVRPAAHQCRESGSLSSCRLVSPLS